MFRSIFFPLLNKNYKGFKIKMKDTKIKRLYRSKRNRVIAGVCGGIGEYFNNVIKFFRF